jgi:hypothetical protein
VNDDYTAGTAEEAERDAYKRELWDNPAFHEGRLWGRSERDAEITHEADSNEHAKGYKSGQEDLYTLAYGMTQEWYELKIVNDSQMLWLKELLHEMEKVVYYTFDDDQ